MVEGATAVAADMVVAADTGAEEAAVDEAMVVVVVTVDVVAAEEEDIMVVNQKVNWRLPALLLFLGKVFIMNSISFLKVCI